MSTKTKHLFLALACMFVILLALALAVSAGYKGDYVLAAVDLVIVVVNVCLVYMNARKVIES